MEIANVFEHVSKEKFRSAANKLLGECFLLKKHKDTASDYNYILNNKEAFIEYFDVLGYEVIIDEQNGVIGLNNQMVALEHSQSISHSCFIQLCIHFQHIILIVYFIRNDNDILNL